MMVPRKSARKKVVAHFAVLGMAFAGIAVGASAASAVDPIDTGVQETDLVKPVDPDATPETVALFQNLYYMSGQYYLVGKQDDMVTGYTGGQGTDSRNGGVPATVIADESSAVAHNDNSASKQAYGEHAAVQGMDLGYLELKGEFGQFGPMDATALGDRPGKYPAGGRGPFYGYDGKNIDGAHWDDMVLWAAETYQHGSINTWSWHETNPVTYGGYNGNLYVPGQWPSADPDATAAEMVLPGGVLNNRYQARLDAIVQFNEEVTAANDGTPVPVLFRPYHEHSGDWFWWGIDDMERYFQPVTYDQYATLWKTTQAYLMDHGVHNFLYEISPDRSRLGEPSWLYQDLSGPQGVANYSLIDKYIDTKTWNSTIKSTAHADLYRWFQEAQASDFGPGSFHYDEPIALNNSGVPIDLDPVTGARTANSTQFRDWIDSGKWKTFFMHKWEQGFAGADYVDVYGVDNYWESGNANGHNYHPYYQQQAKIVELFCSSFDYVAEKARADGKIVAMTEGSSQAGEMYNRFIEGCATGTAPHNFAEDQFPNLKYVVYALTWRGGIGTNVTGVNNPNTGPYADYFLNAGEYDFYTAPKYFQQSGDIEVDLEVPEYLGGLGLEFSSSSLGLGTVSLSSDKAFWV
ncbi:MAG: glycoside hydrolase family 26 protein, partial [Bifidobacteriaceae bacterium]|nr:glycoside hydrolase family 26 protein [Bifidobacteriaceae bacterium]